jgi:hypothetical protein
VFLRPGWSIGMAFGQSVIDSSDHQFLVSTSFHLRAMDGM